MTNLPLISSLACAQASLIAAGAGSCDCGTKTPDATYHLAHCRYLKILSAIDEIEAVTQALTKTSPPVAYMTKAGLENWMKGDSPENHVLLRTDGDLRVALYAAPCRSDA